ncbi:hybrid sensor histidine kinase/response regulator [Leptospira jelokensis]|uniref:histidine kinase n=1 Tax=Leptospira jelokensis TaxID=2484931 RepID=A0A4Z1AC25_9LEPT|nr:ATP-binding protein [Leptospira jelokensis]TGL75628.1 response regulator [Leptospira jelokensis]
MNLLDQKKILPYSLGFLWLTLSFLIFSSFFFFYQVFHNRHRVAEFEGKKEWNSKLQEYASYLKDAETGVRGYLLSKDSKFLSPYQTAKTELNSLETYLEDHVEFADTKNLEELIRLSHRKLSHLEAYLEFRPVKIPSKQTLAEGNQKMAEFRSYFDQFLRQKQTRDDFAFQSHKRLNDRLIVVSGSLFLVLSLLIFWMIFVLKKSIRSISEKELLSDRFIEIDDLYQNSPVGFHSIDTNGVFLKVNRTECEWFGYAEAELVGKKKWVDILQESSKQVFFSNFPLFKKQGYIDNLIFEVIKKNGTSMFVNLSATAIYSQNGEMMRTRSVLVDVTKSIVYEKELLEAKKKAEDASKAKSEFLSNMSHELRTPLNAVIGLSLWLLEENPKAEQLEHLKNLKFSSESLLSLINDILDFNKIEERLVIIEAIDFNLKEFLKSIITSFQLRANEKLLEFQIELDPNLPEFIHSDPTRLLQILNNLLSNALKFTHKGFIKLKLKVDQVDSKSLVLHFEISDSGIGIDKSNLKSIFEKFTQANQDTTRKYGGSGLGLAISKALVELMNGKMFVESSIGEGSKFVFTLPCELGKTNEYITIASINNKESLKGKTVLVADDISINRSIVIRFLNRWEIVTLEASNGLEVLDVLNRQSVDLILMDLHMPEMDGYDASVAIRKNKLWKDIPIIALTASAQIETRQQIKAVGMNDFISKPFNPNDLLNKLHTWIAK